MILRSPRERCSGLETWFVRSRCGFWLAVPFLFLAATARGQEAQSVVASVEGNDVSVSSGAGSAVQSSGAGTPVANGSIVTVHSGQARLMLTSGGEVDICGPAKLTLLHSGEAITLALDFGRVRVQLPASTNLRVFTPTIIVTPIDINGAPRDITAGLELDDSLCVTAASGALLLESQFSGGRLVVPQTGQFFFAQGKLVPVARADSTCECQLTDAHASAPSTPLPSLGLTAPAQTVPVGDSQPAVLSDAGTPKPNVEFSTLAHPNEAHPIVTPPKAEVPASPPDAMPTYKIVMPPLSFSAASPAPPPEPAMNMVLLIRTVEVEPNWEFRGHVDPPPAGEQVKGQGAIKASRGRQPKPEGERGGFWAKVKKFFSGSNS